MLPASRAPNLEQLRNQARDLLKAFRSGDPLARKRATLHLPQFVTQSRSRRAFLLSDALFVVARECGFASWPKLKSHVQAVSTSADTTASLWEISGPGATRSTWRGAFVRRLVVQLVTVARLGDVEGVVACLSAIPLRHLILIRGLITESGQIAYVLDTLVAGLGHANPRVRYECAQAMDHLADDRCAEPLRRLLQDPVPRVRRMALHALSCDACKVHPLQTNDDFVALAIDRALSDPSISVRRHAVAELTARRHDPRVARALEALLAGDGDRVILRTVRWALRGRRPEQ